MYQMLDDNLKQQLLRSQKDEITEHHIYLKLSKSTKDAQNSEILKEIADDELKHYNFWKKYTKRDVKPIRRKIWFYYLIARFFGLTFGIRLMEKGEHLAQITYARITQTIPEAKFILEDEELHESRLIGRINEEFLAYVGSVVLGLSDALVELTGALAGLTLTLVKPGLIALAGLIIGIAATFSMGASEYLSTKSEGTSKSPQKAAIYTGTAYLITVLLLISPFLLLITSNSLISLFITIIIAIIIVFVFTFYISIAKDLPFRRRFFEVVSISLGVAALTFIIGIVVKQFLQIEI